MSLNFPNASRSYDATRRSVRFWGHDGAFEISFFVEQDALSRMTTGAGQDEASALRAFDANHERILKAAKHVYSGRRRESYTLVASDF